MTQCERRRPRVVRLAVAVVLLVASPAAGRAQDTFSLLLADARGTIVSAGASCIDDAALPPSGAVAISTVLPGVGALHTQSYYVPANQLRGGRWLAGGLAAKPLVDSLVAFDAAGSPSYRQYAALTLDGAGRIGVAAFTGADCAPWAGHLLGPDYVLAGNILLGDEVLAGMERALLVARASGADVVGQAAAALRAAAFAGADRRCLRAGLSSRSAFLRVGHVGDASTELTIDLAVGHPQDGRDPILTLLDLLGAAR